MRVSHPESAGSSSTARCIARAENRPPSSATARRFAASHSPGRVRTTGASAAAGIELFSFTALQVYAAGAGPLGSAAEAEA